MGSQLGGWEEVCVAWTCTKGWCLLEHIVLRLWAFASCVPGRDGGHPWLQVSWDSCLPHRPTALPMLVGKLWVVVATLYPGNGGQGEQQS